MEDYVLEQTNAKDFPHGYIGRICDYAQLLKSKPRLPMFLPADDKGFLSLRQEVLDNVIFEGWGITKVTMSILT